MSNTLVRLSTQDEKSVFDGDLYEDLVIPAKASVALQNLTILQAEENLIVDNTNDEIEFEIYQGKPLTATLTTATYTKTNLNDLLDDINAKMNGVIANTDGLPVTNTNYEPLFRKYNGSEYNMNISKTGKVQLQYVKTPRLAPVLSLPYIVGKNIDITSAGTMKRDGGTQGDDDSYVYSTKPFVMGAGSIICTIDDLLAGAGIDIIMGLSTENPDITPGVYDESLIKIGLNMKSLNEQMIGIINGVATPLVEPVANTPIITRNKFTYTFELFNGILHLGMYNTNSNPSGTARFKLETQYTYGEELYPIIMMRKTDIVSNTDVVLKKVFWMTSQFYSTSFNDTLNSPVYNEGNITARVPTNNSDQTDMSVKFSGTSLSEYLGFTNSVYNLPAIDNTFNLVASVPNESIFLPQSVVVELMSIPLKSYDTDTHSRKSILAVIPNLSQKQNKVIYEAPYPLYIALNNDKDLLIRNIKARLLNDDLSEMALDGIANMTLLFK